MPFNSSITFTPWGKEGERRERGDDFPYFLFRRETALFCFSAREGEKRGGAGPIPFFPPWGKKRGRKNTLSPPPPSH